MAKKSSVAGKPEGAEGNKRKSREEKRMGKQIVRGVVGRDGTGRGRRGRNAAARKENCTKTRRCVAQLAGRDEGEKYPEGEIPDGWVCVHVYVCVCLYRDCDDGIRKPPDLNGTRGKTDVAPTRKFCRATDRSGLAGRPITYVRPVSIRE